MGVITKIRSVLGADEGRTYAYRCLACDSEFESAVELLKEVECPECGSDQVRDSVL